MRISTHQMTSSVPPIVTISFILWSCNVYSTTEYLQSHRAQTEPEGKLGRDHLPRTRPEHSCVDSHMNSHTSTITYEKVQINNTKGTQNVSKPSSTQNRRFRAVGAKIFSITCTSICTTRGAATSSKVKIWSYQISSPWGILV